MTLLSTPFSIFQSASGIETLVFYGLVAFKEANIVVDSHLLSILLMGAMTLGYFFSTPLLARIGRRPILLLSSVSMTSCMLTLALCLFIQVSTAFLNLGHFKSFYGVKYTFWS